MDFMEISRKRKTVRRFSQTPVEQEKLEKILEAGRWSPTAINLQPQRILVLNTPESLSKVKEFCSFGYDQKYVDLAKECEDKEKGGVNLDLSRHSSFLPQFHLNATSILQYHFIGSSPAFSDRRHT